MKNSILSACLILIIFFVLCGFTWNPNKKANKLYVEASLEASHFLNSNESWADDYSALWDSYKSVKDKIDLILSEYPSSDIAVDLLSGKIKISDLSLKQFRSKEKIVKLMKDAENSAFSCALLVINGIKDEKAKVRQLLTMAKIYAMSGQNEKVNKLVSQAFSFIKDVPRTKIESKVLRHLAVTYSEFGYLENALALAKTIDDPNIQCRTIIDSICKSKDLSSQKNAAQLLSEAIELAKASDKYTDSLLEDIADKCIDLGLLDIALQADNSIKVLKEYLKTNQKEKLQSILSSKTIDTTYDSLEVAKLYVEMGENEKAAKLLSQALEMNSTDDNTYGKAKTLGVIAAQYAKIGQYAYADQLFDKAYDVADSISAELATEEYRYKTIEAATYITCEYADVVKKEVAIKVLLKNVELIDTLNAKGYRKFCLGPIANKFADLDELEQAVKIWNSNDSFNQDFTYGDDAADIASKFIDRGQLDRAFEPFQVGQNEGFSYMFLNSLFKKYSSDNYTDKTEHVLSKLIQVAQTLTAKEYCSRGLDISDYYSKIGLREQESKLLLQLLDTVSAKADNDFFVKGLSRISVRYVNVFEDDYHLEHLLAQLFTHAKNAKKYENRIGLLTIASSILEKSEKELNKKYRLLLHNIVNEIDPLVNL